MRTNHLRGLTENGLWGREIKWLKIGRNDRLFRTWQCIFWVSQKREFIDQLLKERPWS
jgi:hypothetical protein